MIRGGTLAGLCLLAASLPGCAGIAEDPETAMIAPAVRYRLPAPGALERAVDADQMVTARSRTDSFAFEARIGVTPEQLDLAGLDSFGRRALTLRWRVGSLSVQAAPWLPPAIKPVNMLADLTLLYWPDDAVRAALAGSGATLTSDERSRSVLVDGREIVHIDYDGPPAARWSGRAVYRNLAFGYTLLVQSAVVSE